MEFTGTRGALIRSELIDQRDKRAHQPTRSGDSPVSPEALLEAGRTARARLDGPARSPRTDTDVDTAIAAATLPPTGPGQTGRAQGIDGTGARPGAHRPDRTRRDGPTRDK
jgi:hypothetical protein